MDSDNGFRMWRVEWVSDIVLLLFVSNNVFFFVFFHSFVCSVCLENCTKEQQAFILCINVTIHFHKSFFSSVFPVLSMFLYFVCLFIRLFLFDSFLQFCSWHPLCLCFMFYDFGSLSFVFFCFFGSIGKIVIFILVYNCLCWILFIWVDSLVAFNFLHNKFLLTFATIIIY